MKYRTFELKDTITQGEYRVFRTLIQELKPEAWDLLEEMPLELFFDILVSAAVQAKWIQDVTEENEYEEEVTWEWNQEYVDGLPAGGDSPASKWGELVFTRWVEIKTLDPN